MSTDSLNETDPPADTVSSEMSVDQLRMKFSSKDFPHFHVEYTSTGDDVVYHFWPPEEARTFAPGFAKKLEDAFVKILPKTSRVEADYTSLDEAVALFRAGAGPCPVKDFDKATVPARETYYVKVVGGDVLPLADTFLKSRVFEILEDLLEQAC